MRLESRDCILLRYSILNTDGMQPLLKKRGCRFF